MVVRSVLTSLQPYPHTIPLSHPTVFYQEHRPTLSNLPPSYIVAHNTTAILTIASPPSFRQCNPPPFTPKRTAPSRPPDSLHQERGSTLDRPPRTPLFSLTVLAQALNSRDLGDMGARNLMILLSMIDFAEVIYKTENGDSTDLIPRAACCSYGVSRVQGCRLTDVLLARALYSSLQPRSICI